jgi:hypothetical protein
MLGFWEIAALAVAAWFLLRVTRGRRCGGRRGLARTVFVVGAVVLGGMAMSHYWHAQRRQVPARAVAVGVAPQRNVRFGYQPSGDDFGRIDADELKQYRAQVARRARTSALPPAVAEAPASAAEAQAVPPAAPLSAETPEAPRPAPPPPAIPAAPAPAAKPAAQTTNVQVGTGPPRVEMDADEEPGLPSSNDITRAATSLIARATVEAVKQFTRASADAAKKTAAQLASGSKKTTGTTDTARTETTQRAATAEAPSAVGSYSTSDGHSGGTGDASYVAQSVSHSSRDGDPVAPAAAADSTVSQAASASKRPAWVDGSLGKQGNVYRTKVVVGPYKTRQECEAELSREMLHTARSVVDRRIVGGSTRIADNVLLPYLFNRVLKEEWEEQKESDTAAVGEMIYLHALLEFDDRSWQELNRMQHQREIEQRLAVVGAGAGLLLLLLGTVFAYLKLDTMTRGYYTRRLQLLAGVVILALVGAAVLPLLK